jgi:hypothetical protein
MTARLNEEQIRDLLLVNLNAQFEGKAGGEVFNGEGKTDILIGKQTGLGWYGPVFTPARRPRRGYLD